MIRKIALLSLLQFIFAADLFAQPEMADGLRANGKIYVVVVVLATIFAGIFVYLIRLDRKITQIEKEKN